MTCGLRGGNDGMGFYADIFTGPQCHQHQSQVVTGTNELSAIVFFRRLIFSTGNTTFDRSLRLIRSFGQVTGQVHSSGTIPSPCSLAPRHAVMQINSSPLDPGVLADSAGFGNTRAKVVLSPRSDGRSASGYTADEIRFCNDYRPANPVARRFHYLEATA